eukprot:1858881-Rhodomonas_salina.1
MTGVSLGNHVTTGQGSLTVSGGDLGRSGYSVGGLMGETGCEGTWWVSESSLTCKAPEGTGGSLRAVMSV